MPMNLTIATLEPKTGWTTREEYLAVQMIQNDCVRTMELRNELGLKILKHWTHPRHSIEIKRRATDFL